jgi:predicted transcriptional regulator
MPSTTTTILPVRVEHQIIARLDKLAELAEGSSRTALAREALTRGLQLLEQERSAPKAKKPSSTGKSAAAETAAAATAAVSAAVARPKNTADLSVFAAEVLAAARRCRTGWFGQERLFISHLYRQYKREHPEARMTLPDFKELLLYANRARSLSLVCDDLSPYHKQADVKASEIQYLSATFHFLCVEPDGRPHLLLDADSVSGRR